MDESLLFTLTLQGVSEENLGDKLAADRLIGALQADLREFGSKILSPPMEEGQSDPKKGIEKGPGTWLGILAAEVHGEMVALKIIRHLLSTVTDQAHPFELEVVDKQQDGSERTLKLKGPVRDAEALTALLTQAVAFLMRSK